MLRGIVRPWHWTSFCIGDLGISVLDALSPLHRGVTYSYVEGDFILHLAGKKGRVRQLLVEHYFPKAQQVRRCVWRLVVNALR